MFKILSVTRKQPTTVNYQQLMIEFLTGIVEGVRAEPDPYKADWKYWCIQEILLEHGQFMEGGQAQQIGIPQQCYQNCLSIIFAPENPEGLIYCEGLALSDTTNVYPIEHAWVMFDNEVIDVTWNELSPCYFGIPFNRQWVMEKTEEKQTSGDSEINFLNYNSPLTLNLLQYGLPVEAKIID
ncbi:hypothetical protein [Crocosphaera sp. XPORK-15E]|uniref:hypothetical protein n=1 Tax=Crocosphaera sp. XPORK-15E TaxID=3110247 RepID=UPI002B1F3243|nr:hypothetical protein [Crocosphaera sp. XPORK-15E]MEA5536789.1 hypothetical protein [Crocosphaera sp. XPORK-15E]